MRDFFSGLITAARRTAQPYAYTVRAALGYIIAATCILLLFAVFRLTFFAPELVGALPARSASAIAVAALPDYIRAVLDHLSAAIVISIIAAALLLLVTTRNRREGDLTAVEPWNIHPALVDALAQTRNYWFRGRSGRFMRDTVLPELDDNARKEATQRKVHLLLPDPADNKTMKRYAEYRNSLAMSSRDRWTAARIRTEVLATILRAAELSANNHFLEVEVSVSSSFALYRSDMSDRRLIMTREEPKWPALMCSAGSVFYDSFLEEMRIAHSLGTRLNLSGLEFGIKIEESTVSVVLRELGLGIELAPEDIAAILKSMRAEKSSPYV
jgi:hypothetical protein